MSVIYFAPLILILYYFAEFTAQRFYRSKLKRTVTVNGTRGKSTVTRLVRQALSAEFNVFAKTTGTAARWIAVDGSETPVKRRGKANIREMAKGLKLAVKGGADSYVAECMAIKPEYQKIIEEKWMRSDVVVITNIRHDHEDVLGFGLDNVTKALTHGLTPHNTVITVPEAKELIIKYSTFPPDKIITANESDISDGVFDHDFIDRFFAINIALALKTAEYYGIPQEKAIAALKDTKADPGGLEIGRFTVNSRKVKLIAAFAANDPQSTLIIAEKHPSVNGELRGIWLNARADRRERTVTLLNGITNDINPDFIIFSGDNNFIRNNVKTEIENVFYADLTDKNAIEKIIDNFVKSDIWLIGVGNTAGLQEQFAGKEVICRKLS